jgi:uridine phosphorylase
MLNPVDRLNDKPIFSAADLLEHKRRSRVLPDFPVPHGAFLCYQPSLMQHLKKSTRARSITGFFGDFFLLKYERDTIGVSGNFGIGSPAAVVILEELAAYGIKKFLSVGIAGGLQPAMQAGDVVVCDQALRDEGTSFHYLPTAEFAFPGQAISVRICQTLKERQLPFIVGASWTTDEPFRETIREVEQHQIEGVKTVEMEAAALFAAGERIGVEVGAVFSLLPPGR